ncbi:MAG: LamG-like jellyroll fold domain-containing protein [Nitrososphaeria archaeon]
MPTTLRHAYKPHYNQNNLIMETDPTLVLYLPNPNILKQNNDLNPYTWPDYSNYGNHGTIYGATWTEKGLYFDGIDDYVIIPHYPLMEQGEFTLTLWQKVEKCTTSWTFSVSKDWLGGQSGWMIENKEYSLTSVETSFIWNYSGGYQGISYLDNIYGRWCFIAVVYSESLNIAKLYFNGVLKSQLSPITPYGKATGSLILWGSSWMGNKDEIRFYNRVLSDAEVQALYQNGLNERFNRRVYYEKI